MVRTTYPITAGTTENSLATIVVTSLPLHGEFARRVWNRAGEDIRFEKIKTAQQPVVEGCELAIFHQLVPEA